MEEKTNYTVVGLVVLILAAGLFSAGLWLSVGFDQKNYQIFAVDMSEAVSGLNEESIVKYNGVKVGTVRKIQLNYHNPQQVRILLSIEEGIPITTSTSATLISQGITGNTYVGLSASSPDLTPLVKKPGQPYPVIPAKPSLLNQLDSVLKEVSENINEVSLQINQIFNQETADALRKTMYNLQTFTDVIAANSANISQSLQSADIFLQNMAEISHELPSVFREIKTGTHKFNLMANSVTDAGKKVASAMEAGKFALDKISQQTIPPAVIMLQRLDAIMTNIELVSRQMRQNPAVVIRGATPPTPGPGE